MQISDDGFDHLLSREIDRLWREELDQFCARCDRLRRLCSCGEEEDDISCIDCGYSPCECEVGYGPVVTKED